MGVDARVENERGHILNEVPDPFGRVNWLVSFVEPTESVCLRFVDSYGNTVFNAGQLVELKGELEALRDRITDEALRAEKDEYLRTATIWPAVARTEAARYVASFSAVDLTEHLEKLLVLIEDAQSRGPHHYLRFVGD